MLVLLLSLLSAPALAQDEEAIPDLSERDYSDEAPLDEDDTADAELEVARIFDEPDLEIIVTDERTVKIARDAVEEQLVDMGYSKQRRRGDRTYYVHETGWRQRVVVDDDGWMYFRRRHPHVVKPELRGDFWFEDQPVIKWAPCIVLPTACVSVGSWTRRPQLMEDDRERTVIQTEDEMRNFANAVAGKAIGERLYDGIPDMLDAIWLHGELPDGGRADTPDHRRRAILEFWLSRTDNPYGDAVREVVEVYMAYEIQLSDHPFQPAEITWANTMRTNQRELVLPSTRWTEDASTNL